MDFMRAGLFAFYISSLRLDTSFHFLPLVTLFVNQYDTVDTALASFFSRNVFQDAVSKGALQSSTRYLVHGRGLRPATTLTVHPAASLGSQRSACQVSRQVNSTAIQHDTEIQERDDRSTQRSKPQRLSSTFQKYHCLKWVVISTNPAESYPLGLLTAHSIWSISSMCKEEQ